MTPQQIKNILKHKYSFKKKKSSVWWGVQFDLKIWPKSTHKNSMAWLDEAKQNQYQLKQWKAWSAYKNDHFQYTQKTLSKHGI